jgi:hypothetical protein
MKKTLILFFYIVFEICSAAQQTKLPVDSIPNGYFITHSREELMKKLSDLPI